MTTATTLEMNTFFTDVATTDRDVDISSIWDGDCCNRAGLALELRKFIHAQHNPLTIGLDGSWGSGKSFFLKRFAKEFHTIAEGEKRPLAIYLNAWECDYLQNPLLFVYYHLANALDKRGILDPATKKTLFTNLGNIGMVIADKLLFDMPSAIKDKTDKAIDENPLSIFEKETELTNQLKLLLAQLANNIRIKTDYPIVVCIDELDRCRPLYAIEMLERIKHCCSVPNVIFILGIDRRQLAHSIQAIYGGIDVNNYLRRFIQFPFSLPNAQPGDYLAMLWREGKFGNIVHNLADRLSVSVTSEYGNNLEAAVLYIFKHLVIRARLTLRQVEDALCRYYRMGLASQPPHLIDFILLAIISTLKAANGKSDLLCAYICCKDKAKPVHDFFFSIPMCPPSGRSDIIDPEVVMRKIIEYGAVRSSDEFGLESAGIGNWPDCKSINGFHLGNVLSSMLKHDLTCAKVNLQSNRRFPQSRVQALYERTEFHFQPDSGWYTNGMIFT